MAANKGKTRRLALKDIRVDGGTQSRAAIHPETVEEYAEAMQAGDAFPPLVVYYDGKVYWLADGFHRYEAAQKAKFRTFECEVKQGTQRDAILHSVGANSTHGLRRTNSDKRRAVEVLLRDQEWSQWSDREIARRTGVSDRFVNNLRKEVPTANGSQSGLRRGADGRVTDTTNIGSVAAERRAFACMKGVYYPVDTIHRIVYNEPFQTAEEIPEGYRAAEGQELKTEVRYHMYRFVDEVTPEPEGPKLEQVLWVGGRFYPVDIRLKFIFNDPLTQGQIEEARRVWYPRADFTPTGSLMAWSKYEAAGWILQPSRRLASGSETEPDEVEVEQAGEDGEYQPPEPESSPEHDPQEDGAEGHTKYHKGQAAICGKCEAVYEMRPEDATYTNWERTQSPAVIWACPRGHRVADSLMRLLDDEMPAALVEIIGEEPSQPAPPKIVVPGKFGVILADPPWKYDYPTTPYRQMSPAEMAGLPVADLAAENCALFMWVTWAMLQQALNLGVAWGFEYTGVCAAVWVKLRKGLAANTYACLNSSSNWHHGATATWTQPQTEICLLFTRGNPERVHGTRPQLIVASVRKHSQKPDEQYELIQDLAAGPYLELFAREKREGWFAWGNEIESDIELKAMEA